MATTSAIPDNSVHTIHALRVATAATVCLLLAEYWNMSHGALAVWTTHMVMVAAPLETAMAAPQPKVLNFISSMTSSLTLR